MKLIKIEKFYINNIEDQPLCKGCGTQVQKLCGSNNTNLAHNQHQKPFNLKNKT